MKPAKNETFPMKWGWVKSSGEGINLEQEKIFLLWILEAKR